MQTEGCTCASGIANLGKPNCVSVPKVLFGLLFGEYLNDLGKPRFIDISPEETTGILPADYFDLLINDPNQRTRLFPTGPIENFKPATAANEVYTTTNGNKSKVRDGIKTYAFDIIDGACPTLYAKYKSLECKRLGFYGIDTSGNMSGDGSEVFENNHFKLIPVQKNSFSVIEMDATDTQPYMIHIEFDIPASYNRGNVRVLEGEYANTDLKELSGLIDVNGVVSDAATTGATVTLTFDFGPANGAEAFEGGVLGDFVLEQIEPAPLVISITDVEETDDGVYDFTWAAQTSGDVLELSMSKNGFDLQPVRIVIP